MHFCNGLSNILAYDLANDPLGESHSGGVLGGLATTNLYDSLLCRTTLSPVTYPDFAPE